MLQQIFETEWSITPLVPNGVSAKGSLGIYPKMSGFATLFNPLGYC